MADKEKTETTSMVESPSSEERKMLQGQADQMYGNAAYHAPAIPTTLSDAGAPPAQGPNLSKEEAEFAANVAANPKAEDLPAEKIPAPVQASEEPLVKAGKAPK